LPKETTAILFVGDHGESLYEHDYLGHGRRVYQTGMHIPLIVRGPGIEPGRSNARVRGIDVGPTLLGLAGLDVPASMLGADIIYDDVAPDRVRVIETYGGAVPKLPGARAVMAGRPPMRQGVFEDGWKLILDGKKAELYHLDNDPMEEQDLARDEPDRVAELKVLIATWDTETVRREGEEAELSKDDLQALRDLGYVGDD
jgi:arylsulfatase A-like enzyme